MQLILLEPKPQQLRDTRMLSLMHKGWDAAEEGGRNKVATVGVHPELWDDLPSMLGIKFRLLDDGTAKLWGAQVVRDYRLQPGEVSFRCARDVLRAVGTLGETAPEPLPMPLPPLRIVTLARKPVDRV